MKFKDGQTVVCVDSKSNAYKKHSKYKVSKDNAGILQLTGDDGLNDYCSMLVSVFSPVSDVKVKAVA